MALITLIAAASFACVNPRHHDGDAIRCEGIPKAMRLHAIDAPEMPGACRPGRACTPGDPYRSRDYLAGLTRGKRVTCDAVDTDRYGRQVVDCTADGRNLGCDMIAAGMAAPRYGQLDCGPARLTVADQLADVAGDRTDTPSRAELVDLATPGAAPLPERTQIEALDPAPTVRTAWLTWPRIGLWLLVMNLLAAVLFFIDKRRAMAGDSRRRVPESTLLLVAAIGGSAGAIAVQQILRHKTRKRPFANRLLMIAGVHLGIILALAAPVI
ncbi:DUF1294 domain-containing protein [Sandarakinorhabdus sp. DWP1-3-1]|uniref:DUF1294 domain-containing protein n=1 Tax=Sandarakinorhabdus sp. DWP1-3-1 TaxID=2804627 RepID=UPI003CFA572C